MRKDEQDTKERILNVALNLFCVDGYSAVSIRDIGKAVGIKESSIYYHFKNKEDILHSLFRKAEQWTLVRKEQFNLALESVPKVERGKFIAAGISYLDGYLLEENMNKLIRMLTIEKQRNPEAAELYRQLLFNVPLNHHKQVFSFMIDKGWMAGDDLEHLAAEYQSRILYVFHKYFPGCIEATSEERALAQLELSSLLERFFDQYIGRGNH